MRAAGAFRDLADALPEPLLLVRSDGVLLDLNRSAAQWFGHAREHLLGQPLSVHCIGDALALDETIKLSSRSRSLVPSSLRIAREGAEPLDCRCDAGLYRPKTETEPAIVVMRLSHKKAATGEFRQLNERLVALGQEVTRRKRAEAELQAISAQLRVTLASIGDAVVSTDLQGRVTFTNEVAERLMGLASPPIGRRLQDVFVIVNETTREPVVSPVDKVLHTGRVVGLANHTVLLRPDGTEVPIDDSGAPIRDPHGATIGVVMVFRDVSERRSLEQALLAHTRHLEEASRRKDEFLSMLAHELRNPLAPLATSIALLDRLHGSLPRVNGTLQTMRRQVGHMTRLVDDLLDVARLTRGSIALHKEPVDLAEVVAQAVEMARPLAERQGVELVAPEVPSLLVEGDPARLVQVLANLLANAAKFTPRGGVATVSARADDGHAELRVLDTGVGIEPDLLPTIFDLFVQGDRSLDRTAGGLGVGLTIVHSIVGLHGGTVEASSAGHGHGSEFVVRLPLLTTAVAPPTPLPDAAGPHRPLQILLVDDNIDSLEALSDMLTLDRHIVRTAHDGASALRELDHFQPDALLLDIGLPGMSGYELARLIRCRAGFERTLLVAISGYGNALAKQQSQDAGIDQHLTKPVDFETLMRVVRAGRPGPAR